MRRRKSEWNASYKSIEFGWVVAVKGACMQQHNTRWSVKLQFYLERRVYVKPQLSVRPLRWNSEFCTEIASHVKYSHSATLLTFTQFSVWVDGNWDDYDHVACAIRHTRWFNLNSRWRWWCAYVLTGSTRGTGICKREGVMSIDIASSLLLFGR